MFRRIVYCNEFSPLDWIGLDWIAFSVCFDICWFEIQNQPLLTDCFFLDWIVRSRQILLFSLFSVLLLWLCLSVRQKKIENMDDTDIDDLALELEGEDDAAESKKKAEDLKIQKKKARLAERLAAEARKAEKAAKRGSKKKSGDEEDDDGDVAIFAKGSRMQKKK